MNDINLRNWRDERRKARTKSYIDLNMYLTIGLIVALFSFNLFSSSYLKSQESINDYLKIKQTVLNDKLSEIGELETEISDTTARMDVITYLQGERSSATVIFNEIVEKTPKEVKLISLKKEKGVILIEGVSVSQLNISNYLKNLESSTKIKDPRLEQVLADEKIDGFERSRFFIKAKEITNKKIDIEVEK